MEHIEKNLQLTGDSILLRPYQEGDMNQVYEAVRESITELKPWMPWCHDDYSIEESKTFITSQPKEWESGTNYQFAIIDSSNGQYLGGCGINHINYNDRVVNLGYWVRTSRTRQGVATESTLLLVHFGFDRLNLNRIEILAAVDNKASQRVAEKAGAVREGILRNRNVIQDRINDTVVFSFIPSDFNIITK